MNQQEDLRRNRILVINDIPSTNFESDSWIGKRYNLLLTMVS